MEAHETLQPCMGIVPAWFGVPCGDQLVHVGLEQVEQQRLFVGRIKVESPRLHPNRACDLAHRDSGKPVPRKEPLRLGADLRAGNLGMGASLACHDTDAN